METSKLGSHSINAASIHNAVRKKELMILKRETALHAADNGIKMKHGTGKGCQRLIKQYSEDIKSLKSLLPVINEYSTSIFKAPEKQAFAHCISACCSMSAGVAVSICKTYPENRRISHLNLNVGDVAVVETSSGKLLFNLVTKNMFYDKPTYESLEETLKTFRLKCDAHDVRKIAIPRIGCGRDKLEWKIVKPLIKIAFHECFIDINVHNLNVED